MSPNPPSFSASAWGPAVSLLSGARARGAFTGAQVLVSGPRGALFEAALGETRLGAGAAPVTCDTWFDLASLTKALVTAPLAMTAVASGALSPDDPISRFFPEAPPEKRGITVSRLLSHASGLPAWAPYYRELVRLPEGERRAALRSRILAEPLLSPPGAEARYSDLGYMLLGMLLEDALGASLCALAHERIFSPLGVTGLGFLPFSAPEGPRNAPVFLPRPPAGVAAAENCPWRGRVLEGEVSDENAWALSGVAGHAGLFGSARGVTALLSALWARFRGEVADAALPGSVVRAFWRRQTTPSHTTWCLGYDTPSPEGSSAGRHFSPESVGHLGFTGTSFWLDPTRGVCVVLLTNRVHPSRENDAMKALRPRLHDTVMEILQHA